MAARNRLNQQVMLPREAIRLRQLPSSTARLEHLQQWQDHTQELCIVLDNRSKRDVLHLILNTELPELVYGSLAHGLRLLDAAGTAAAASTRNDRAQATLSGLARCAVIFSDASIAAGGEAFEKTSPKILAAMETSGKDIRSICPDTLCTSLGLQSRTYSVDL
jgi:hypothetical protein